MTEAPTTLQSADIVKIPISCRTAIRSCSSTESSRSTGTAPASGLKNVTFNEPQFTGHFPSRPIFPGIYLIEGMAQTAGAICVASQIAERAKPKQVFFMTVDKRKFRKPVEPGDTVKYHMTKLNNRRNMWWYKGEARVGEMLLGIQAEVSAMLVSE